MYFGIYIHRFVTPQDHIKFCLNYTPYPTTDFDYSSDNRTKYC